MHAGLLQMGKKEQKKQTRTRSDDVVTREYTINVHKRIHKVYAHFSCCCLLSWCSVQ